MKHHHITAVTLLALCVALGAAAGPAPSPAGTPSPLKVGSRVTVRTPVDIAHLSSHPKKYLGRTVRLEGTVKQVCQGMGCWVEVASARGGSFLAKSLDESVLLPKDCAGRKIVVQGVVTALAAAGESAEAHAEHGGADHSCPQPSYVVATSGVELMPAPAR